jgi:DNA polymerase-3 subunit gamma/tau
MSYLVLARKWRPRHFDEVVGQEHVARTLRNSLEQDRVAHAYLFCGARGVGKTSTARILAKALNCDEGPTARPCYDCQSCEDITEGQSVDVYEIDGASNRGINEIRELREGVRYAPSQGRYKIYIIDEVHMLTTEAFNALLKTLEEPPEHAYFIFATTEPQKIPITILSRCQRFDFKRISQRDIVEHLSMICDEEDIDIDETGLQLMARQADGAMRDALSLMDQVIGFAGDSVTEDEVANILGVANREHLFEISEAILERDAEEALSALDTVHRYGYDMQEFASELVTHLRDLTVAAAVDDPNAVTDLTASELEEARRQLEHMGVTGEARRQLLHRYFSVMADGASEMTRSPYPKLIFEMTLVRLTELEPLVGLDLLVDKLETLEGEFDDVDPPSGGLGDAKGDTGGSSSGGSNGGGSRPSSGTRGDEASHTSTTSETSRTSSTSATHSSASSSTATTDTSSSDTSSTSRDESHSASSSSESHATSGDSDPASTTSTPDTAANATVGVDESSPPSDDSASSPTGPSPPPRGETPASSDKEDTEEGLDTSQVESRPAPSVEDASEQTERWRRVVEHLREHAGEYHIKYERAHPEHFELDDAHIELGCANKHHDFLADHLADIEEAAGAVFGGDWSVELDTWSEEREREVAEQTLAARRRQRRRARKQSLYGDVRNHEVVQQARDLFGLDDDDVYVDVALDDGPSTS